MTTSNPTTERFSETADNANHQVEHCTQAAVFAAMPTEEQSAAIWRKIEESEASNVQ